MILEVEFTENEQAFNASFDEVQFAEGGGVTVIPYIGDNENWWINGVDTGKPSRGEQGPAGEDYVLTDADKADIANGVLAALNSEIWTFTLSDGITIEKEVLLK